MNKKQISEGSSKESKQALVVIQEDEGFNWNKYIPKEKLALVEEVGPTREERHARMRLSDVYKVFMEAKNAKRWDGERKCYLDPERNLTVDPDVEGIRRVIFASVEKKKSVEKIVDESQKLKNEILKETTCNTTMADLTMVTTQTESTESSDKAKSIDINDEIDNKSEKYMKCSARNAWKHAVLVLRRMKT
ncbi:hypothetical protein Hanom_Chr02g00135031 [Helianthus anomalus]